MCYICEYNNVLCDTRAKMYLRRSIQGVKSRQCLKVRNSGELPITRTPPKDFFKCIVKRRRNKLQEFKAISLINKITL